jgi:hypothetical protein
MIVYRCDVCGSLIDRDSPENHVSVVVKGWSTEIAWEKSIVHWAQVCLSCGDAVQTALATIKRNREPT